MPQTVSVGIDLGFTFTGVVVALVNPQGHHEFKVLRWPGAQGPQTSKTPTCISYPPGSEQPKWGFQARSNPPTYSWFKILLGDDTKPDDIRDTELEKYTRQRLARRPLNKTASQMVSDFLRQIRLFENAQDAMRQAIRNAGFGTETPGDVHLSSESDAAAVYVLQQEKENIKTGHTFVLCDIGGCTIDLACYKVISKEPTLNLQQITNLTVRVFHPIGGSMTIDTNFLRLMNEWFMGFEYVFEGAGGLQSEFMQRLEDLKRSFDGSTGRYVLPFDLGTINSAHYGSRGRCIIISHEELQGLFMQTVTTSIEAIHEIVSKAQSELRKFEEAVNHLCITGGFADSAYAKSLYGNVFHDSGLRLVYPESPELATSYGSALKGISDVIHTRTKSARSYGIYHPTLLSSPKSPMRDIRKQFEWHKRPAKKALAQNLTCLRLIDIQNLVYEGDYHDSMIFNLFYIPAAMPQIQEVQVLSIDNPNPRPSYETTSELHQI
ncbi:hypothetical protein BO94DRAFT_599666 [Aspergillus sclerotioniger CBS 115572]|uniref:Actin-like ATPase domain-containing protein n=1 Tax=Aspergillus sclerotioniger CBS 115572 TaxID=1450535 RepID=A0A317W992_9EURO|nr:hypothetical protein BO94DRAFT_599666 [Aspergillus sclerotioniger CBS 115572]PWY83176.1 hypothetical protein BO94DRAFT_599666 [Aspergillus sclerotioniger CBS 115572]